MNYNDINYDGEYISDKENNDFIPDFHIEEFEPIEPDIDYSPENEEDIQIPYEEKNYEIIIENNIIKGIRIKDEEIGEDNIITLSPGLELTDIGLRKNDIENNKPKNVYISIYIIEKALDSLMVYNPDEEMEIKEKEIWLKGILTDIYEEQLDFVGIMNTIKFICSENRRKYTYDLFRKYFDESLDYEGNYNRFFEGLKIMYKEKTEYEFIKMLSVFRVSYYNFLKVYKFFKTIVYEKGYENISKKEITKNPYLISEFDDITSYLIEDNDIEVARIKMEQIESSIYSEPVKDIYLHRAYISECIRKNIDENNSTFITFDDLNEAWIYKFKCELNEEIFEEEYIKRIINYENGKITFNYIKNAENIISDKIEELCDKDTDFSERIIDWHNYFNFKNSRNDSGFVEKAEILDRMKRKKIFLLGGAAGTGKSTIISAYLKALTDERMIRPEEVLLLAPTGKAASRLNDLKTGDMYDIRTIASGLFGKTRIKTSEGGYQLFFVKKGRWIENEFSSRKKKDIKLLIIDEASMIDLMDFKGIMEVFINKGIKQIILIGDRKQLPPIGLGRIFSYLSEKLENNYGELRIINRYDSEGIQARFADYIKSGEKKVIDEELTRETVEKFESPEELRIKIKEYIRKNEFGESFTILTPHNKGMLGVNSLNYFIKKEILQFKNPGYFNNRERVMQLRNIRGQVVNGQIGTVHMDNANNGGKIGVYFDNIYKVYEGSQIHSNIMPAYALTIHKAQGSEFDNIIIILPEKSRLLNRELLYTACTRFRKSIKIFMEKNDFNDFILELPFVLDNIKMNLNIFEN